MHHLRENQEQMEESSRRCPRRSRAGWNCLSEGVPAHAGWFLRWLPTQTISHFCDSLLCFPDSLEFGWFGTRRDQSLRSTSWKPLEMESAVGQDSSSPYLSHHAAKPRAQCPFHQVTALSCSQPLQQPRGLEGLLHVWQHVIHVQDGFSATWVRDPCSGSNLASESTAAMQTGMVQMWLVRTGGRLSVLL